MLNGRVDGDLVHGNYHNTYNFNYSSATEAHSLDPTSSSTTAVAPDGAAGCLSPCEKKDILDRLPFAQLDARLLNLRKAQAKTCEWVTRRKDYKTWFESSNLEGNDGFFWIKGNPGTGKSTTMKFLYQTTRRRFSRDRAKDKLTISFFFNARGNDFEKSTLGLYRSLLFNLLTLEPSLQDALDHCGRGGYRIILETGWHLQMLKEIFEEAVRALQNQNKKLYCYIDALDECPEDDVQDMVSYFENLAAETDSRHFRVCFSSRHYPQIFIQTK